MKTQGLSIDDQLGLIEDAKKNLPQFALNKLNRCLENNPGLSSFIEKFKNGNEYEFKQNVKFAPLVTVDVERSFSQYKYILSDRRTRLTDENIERLNIVMFDQKDENTGDVPLFDLF